MTRLELEVEEGQAVKVVKVGECGTGAGRDGLGDANRMGGKDHQPTYIS